MCLQIVGRPKKLTSKENITVYKALMFSHGAFITPFRFCEVKMGEVVESTLIVNKSITRNRYHLNIGLHSFLNLDDIKSYFKNRDDLVFVECVIPKGTKYYKGTTQTYLNYASTKLHYLRVLDEND